MYFIGPIYILLINVIFFLIEFANTLNVIDSKLMKNSNYLGVFGS